MTKRLFLGIPCEEELLAKIKLLASEIEKICGPEVKLIPIENVHLTLHFLGSISEEKIPALVAALKRVRTFSGFSFPFNQWIAFPSFAKARVFAIAGALGNSPLSNLFFKTGQCLEYLRYPLEDRLFHPHISLARFKNIQTLGAITVPAPCLELKVHSYCLYESETLPEGSRYKILHTFPL